MKRLRTELTGGFNFVLDDIETIQSNVQELTSAIAESLSLTYDNIFILYGCDISVTNSGGIAPTLVITKGAIWYTDEIFLVDAVSDTLADYTTLNDVLTNYYWDLYSTTDSPRIFYDTLTKNAREIRKAIFTETPTTWTSVQDLKSYKDIVKNKFNIDILNKDWQNPATFTAIYTSGSYVYRSYTLTSGEHILRLTTPSGGNCHLAVINPPSDVFDGYELTIEIKSHGTATRGLIIYGQIGPGGNVVSNIVLNAYTYPYTYSGITEISTLYYTYPVSFNTVSHTNIYAGGEYDIMTTPSGGVNTSGRFKMLLRWNSKTNKWNEISRVKLLS